MVSFEFLTHSDEPQRLAQRVNTTSLSAFSRAAISSAEGSTLTSLPGLPAVHLPVPVVQAIPSSFSSMITFQNDSCAVFICASRKALVLSSSLLQVARLTAVKEMVKPT